MRTSSVAVRGLVLAILGLGAGSASGQNVTAFNPYDGVGLPGGQPPSVSRGGGSIPVDQAAPVGPAFNPWNPSAVQAGGRSATSSAGVAAVPRGQQLPAAATYGVPYYDRGSNLPAPPPDALHSRVVAIPQKGQPTTAPRGGYAPPATGSGRPVPLARSEEPPPAPPLTPAPPAAVAPPPVTTQPAPPPAPAAPVVVATPAQPSAPPAQAPETTPRTAAVAPPPPPEPEPPRPSPTPPTSTVLFAADSAEINDAAKAELDRIAKSAAGHGVRQIELRAYAGGGELIESRKVALARALAVRSYLIDQGVKARIEVGTFGPAAKGTGPSDRVDLVAPGI